MEYYKDDNGSIKDEIIFASYEYIFLLLGNWFTQSNIYTLSTRDTKTIDPIQFDRNNDLTTSKLLLYPFFFATANGHSRDLYDILGPFYALEDGPVPNKLLNWVMSDHDEAENILKNPMFIPDYLYKSYRIKTGYGLAIKSINESTTWECLREEILNREISKGIAFKDIYVHPDKEPNGRTLLSSALESSLKSMKKIDENFIKFSSKELNNLTQFFRAYSYYYLHKKTEPISYDYVKSDLLV